MGQGQKRLRVIVIGLTNVVSHQSGLLYGVKTIFTFNSKGINSNFNSLALL